MKGSLLCACHMTGPQPGSPAIAMANSVILATAGYDHKIRFWEAPTGVCSRHLRYPDSQVSYQRDEGSTRIGGTRGEASCGSQGHAATCRSIAYRSLQTSSSLRRAAIHTSGCLKSRATPTPIRCVEARPSSLQVSCRRVHT